MSFDDLALEYVYVKHENSKTYKFSKEVAFKAEFIKSVTELDGSFIINNPDNVIVLDVEKNPEIVLKYLEYLHDHTEFIFNKDELLVATTYDIPTIMSDDELKFFSIDTSELDKKGAVHITNQISHILDIAFVANYLSMKNLLYKLCAIVAVFKGCCNSDNFDTYKDLLQKRGHPLYETELTPKVELEPELEPESESEVDPTSTPTV
jgi:hypothetical protein